MNTTQGRLFTLLKLLVPLVAIVAVVLALTWRPGTEHRAAADTPPMVTMSCEDSGCGNPSPRSQSRPPSTTRTGSRLVSNGKDQLSSNSRFQYR